MTAKDLKAALLQEAVQGKLVPQIASEGNARELLEEIKKIRNEELGNSNARHAELVSASNSHADSELLRNSIKSKKAGFCVAKSNPCGNINDEEKPFDIPQSWCWCRLGEIASVTTGMTPLKSENKFYENGTIPWITSSLTDKDFINTSETFITDYAIKNTSLSIYPVHTLVLAMYGQGKTRGQISELLLPATINQACAAIELYKNDDVLRKYIKFFHKWNYDRIRKESSGSAQPNLNLSKVQNTFIPLPPLAEQKRIVAALEKMLPLVEEYGKKEEELSALNEKISSLAKKAVLQEAVQGKLVPQIESEGNARELLEQIREQLSVDSGQRNKGTRHAELVSASVNKRSRNKFGMTNAETSLRGAKATVVTKTNAVVEPVETAIPDEEKPCLSADKPFDIPQSWEWCRLGEICDYLHRGKSPKYGTEKILPIMAQKCNQWDKIYTDKCLFAEKSSINRYTPEQYLQLGDTLINSTGGGTVGRTGFVDEYVFSEYKQFVADSHVTVVRPNNHIEKKYVFYFLISPLIQIGLEDKCSGSTNQIELGTATIANFLIPLPPLAEQKRIVTALEKILPLCEKLGK